MEKSLLRSVLSGLVENQEITVNFRKCSTNPSAIYRVLGTRTGRGKGGSLLADVVLASEATVTDENKLVIGTPHNDQILNVVVNGDAIGYTSEDEIPIMYETNKERSDELKALVRSSFKDFFEGKGTPRKIAVVSSVPELNGEFTVTGVKQLRGRGGQVVLETAEGREIWTRRQSGVIESITVIDEK